MTGHVLASGDLVGLAAKDPNLSETPAPSYWANFVAGGNPDGPGLPSSPAFSPQSPTLRELGDHYGPIPVASQARLDFWKRFFQTQEAW
jgi:para-nitrobenzyl esterase